MQPKRRHLLASRASNLWVLLGLGIAGVLLVTKKLKKRVREDFGAFVEKLLLLPPPQPAPPKAPHPLTGLSFAVSDLFDVKGHVSGFGHPDWIKTHEAAASTSPVVSVLVEGGATCVGKTVVDEFAFSISGETKHYDTPTNPAAPAHIPGGSCSGAAVAVAAKLVDFALGIDTVGGVRVPAGYCGVLGFRSSQGIVSTAGIIPVSSSVDAVGWFARDPNTLRRVGHVILQLPFAAQRSPRQIILADDYLQLSKIPADRVSQVVIKSAEKLFGRQALKHENLEKYFEAKVPSLKEFCREKANVDAKFTTSMLLVNVMQLLQRHEFLQNHGDWISTVNLSIDPAIYSQLCKTSELTDGEIENLNAVRNQMRVAIGSLLKDDGILVIPTMPSVPPKLGSKETISEDYQNRASSLLCVASISGCCQVTVPLGQHEKCPVSVSLIARHGGDRFLLDTVQKMYASLQENSSLIANPKSSTNTISQEESDEIAKEKGNQAFKEKQWQKAIGLYSEAIKLNDKNGTYYSNRAAAYLELGSFRQAEADCTKALSLDKKNIKAYLRRGTAREMLGNFKEAIDDFSYALVLEPNNKRAALSADRLKKVFLQ
ncbi:Outer envelope protein 64 [Hirschfeldia incana]|nr:Outer envelope protein 64 [Hirschfeldia incana]